MLPTLGPDMNPVRVRVSHTCWSPADYFDRCQQFDDMVTNWGSYGSAAEMVKLRWQIAAYEQLHRFDPRLYLFKLVRKIWK